MCKSTCTLLKLWGLEVEIEVVVVRWGEKVGG